MSGKTIQIYFPSGDPRSLRIAEVTTRIVRAIEVPRAQLAEFLKRPESAQVGIYFLFGETEDASQSVYVGQSGGVGTRLGQHLSGKDFWTRAVAFVSLTNNWTQTHAAYLEWLSLEQAMRTKRMVLQNGNAGSKPFTPEPLEADCQEGFETIRILLTTLGYPLLESLVASEGKEAEKNIYTCTGLEGSSGRGLYTSEGFVVLAGSTARVELVPSIKANFRFVERRQALVDDGSLRNNDSTLKFEKDVLFKSPSMAASMVLGRSANGWVEWKARDGRSLDAVERTSE